MILSLKMALRSVSSNKLRAILTMLGIIIGVMALVVLVSIVNSATSSVTDAVSSLGSDLLTISISDDHGYTTSFDQLNQWAQESDEIGYIAAYSQASVTGKYNSNSDSMTVYGVTPSYYEIQGLTLSQGRFIKNTDLDNSNRVCIINNSTAEELVGFTDCINYEISLDGIKYTIIGVLSEDENLMSSMMSGTMIAYIPYTSLLRLSDSVSSNISSFVVSAEDGYTMEDVEQVMSDILYERYEEDDDAYEITSLDIMEDAMSSITSVLSIMLGGIAGISLIVGGIGIMNIMLVTVTERTREIGIRKAIGATRENILRQFLMEAVVLCMIGCLIGIFLSWCVLRMLAVVVSSLSMSFSLNIPVVIISVLFCFAIGIVFGLYPANKAAKMKPIDALHYGG